MMLSRPTEEAPLPAVIKLPFINGRLASEVKRRVRRFSSGSKVAFTSSESLSDVLVGASAEPRCCLSKGVV